MKHTLGKLTMKTILVYTTILLLCSACGDKFNGTDQSCTDSIIPTQDTDTILVIGDSISSQYEPTLVTGVASHDVLHNPCNANNTTYTLQNIDVWLASRPSFEAITFNNGIHDSGHTPEWVPQDQYAINLHAIAQKIKAKTAAPMFVLSTQVLPGTPALDNDEIIARNAIAAAVMVEEGVPVFDLYSVSASIPQDHLAPDNVHYTAEGASILGEAVLGALVAQYGI